MKRINLVLRPTDLIVEGDTIGVDAGALFCLDNKIPMLLALGDFDSISAEDLERLKNSKTKIIEFPKEKNEIDFELALNYVDDYDEILVYGGLGNRRDHEYTLIKFVIEDPRLIVMDKENAIRSLRSGTYRMVQGAYKYVSIIPLTKGVISLKGFKYPLELCDIDVGSHFLTSNEIVDEGEIVLHSGRVLLIESKEKESV